MHYSFGIVQGRLSVAPPGVLQWFPGDRWPEEFPHAARLGLRFIELLTERQFNPHNPVWSQTGRDDVRAVARETGRDIYSICTDYIIDHALLGPERAEVVAHMRRFLHVAADLGCRVAIVPLFEQSDLTPDTAEDLLPILKDFARQAAESGTTIAIESMMRAAPLRDMLWRIDEPNVTCVFDTGNRVVDSPDVAGEIRTLGGLIGHVHVKDKTREGLSVLLGTGAVNFYDVFDALRDIGYGGPLVFETRRGTDPVVTAEYHLHLCRFFAHEAARRRAA